MRPQVWSSGGGVQSTAIAALICRGELPKPDLAVIADTGREKSSTWDYLDGVVGPALADAGVVLERLPHSLATVDLYSTNDKRLLIPAFTSIAGRQGRLSNFCSYEWKRRVCQRAVRRVLPGTDVDVWLGFSTDEIGRCKASADSWWHHVFPLIEMRRTSRAECHALIAGMGWPEPPRSSCYMCPLMSDQEWRGLSNADRAKAIELERQVRKRDPEVFFHRGMQPLEDSAFDAQQSLFDDGCRSGYCFT